MKRFYVTTAIPYANAEPHVGHTFELIGTDVIARAKRMLGYEVYFQTGTDEHGQKMLEYAERAGKPPREYANEISPRHEDLWRTLHVSFDRFIRTTDEDHGEAVARFWNACKAAGDIYKGKYEGWYCVTDENFVLESQVKLEPDGRKLCPECGSELTWKSEESYFFRWSKYQDAMTRWVNEHPESILPKFRANEMVNSFLRPGLQDISISRSTMKWGVPVPDDPDHVVYVWFDALINYITGVGYGTDPERFLNWWPADIHIVGKDIFKFHTLLWPAMCMSAGIEPPRRVFGHGFVSPRTVVEDGGKAELRDTIRYEISKVDTDTAHRGVMAEVYDGQEHLGSVESHNGYSTDGITQAILEKFGTRVLKLAKMSKSKGNVVDPRVLVQRYGGNPDPLRYFLMREIDFGGDGIYTDEALESRYNADLADKLGNLLSRTLTMVEKYQSGMVVQPAVYSTEDDAVRDTLTSLFQRAELPNDSVVINPSHPAGVRTLYEQLIDDCRFNFLLERIFAGVQRLNLYITEQKPFTLAKDPDKSGELKAILYVLCEGLRVIATQLYPFIPSTSVRIWEQLGAKGSLEETPFEALRHWGYLDDVRVQRGENLFPKTEDARK
ncbi:MAG: class I tRNA ligase family protein [Candidatus Sumerlaeaceae bacterium]